MSGKRSKDTVLGWLEMIIECPPTAEAFELLQAAAKYKRAEILRQDKRIAADCEAAGGIE